MSTSGEPDIAAWVERAYDERGDAWQSARDVVGHWLGKICDQVLTGADRTRLDTSHSRIKEHARALDKLRQKAIEEDLEISSVSDVERALTDIVGMKVLCKSTRDQKAVFELLTDLEALGQLGVHKERNYVADPKPSGYRACHVILRVPVLNEDPVLVEVQIKTRLQDAWGELTHEDLYKPGAAMKPQPFHESVGRAMASLLAEVDKLADDLAVELESAADIGEADADHDSADSSDSLAVRVRTTGEKYALAVDSDGQQGLIPARAVRDAVGASGMIHVDDYVHVGDRLHVLVQEDERGLYYLPVSIDVGSTDESS
ncbi:GTP pyrophosphokinase [Flexivirga sp. B27]